MSELFWEDYPYPAAWRRDPRLIVRVVTEAALGLYSMLKISIGGHRTLLWWPILRTLCPVALAFGVGVFADMSAESAFVGRTIDALLTSVYHSHQTGH